MSTTMGQNSANGLQAARRDISQVADTDTRLDSSPYVNRLVTLRFADGPPLVVHAPLFQKSFKLPVPQPPSAVDFTNINGDTGHVIIHYLYTGTYTSLKPRGSSDYEKNSVDFTRSLRVFAAAQDYKLSDLETLAKKEVEKLGNLLPTMQVLELLKNLDLSLNFEDAWLQNYLQSLVKPLLDSRPATLNSLAKSADGSLSFANALLKVVINRFCDKAESSRSNQHVSNSSQGSDGKPATAHVDAQPVIDSDCILLTVTESTSGRKESVEAPAKDGEGNVIAHTTLATTTTLPTPEPEPSNAETQQEKSATNISDKSISKPVPKNLFTFNSPPDGTQDPATSHTLRDLYNESISIPSTIGAKLYLDIKESANSTAINRFLHICVQEKYVNFSADELRWKHELHNRLFGFKSRHGLS